MATREMWESNAAYVKKRDHRIRQVEALMARRGHELGHWLPDMAHDHPGMLRASCVLCNEFIRVSNKRPSGPLLDVGRCPQKRAKPKSDGMEDVRVFTAGIQRMQEKRLLMPEPPSIVKFPDTPPSPDPPGSLLKRILALVPEGGTFRVPELAAELPEVRTSQLTQACIAGRRRGSLTKTGNTRATVWRRSRAGEIEMGGKGRRNPILWSGILDHILGVTAPGEVFRCSQVCGRIPGANVRQINNTLQWAKKRGVFVKASRFMWLRPFEATATPLDPPIEVHVDEVGTESIRTAHPDAGITVHTNTTDTSASLAAVREAATTALGALGEIDPEPLRPAEADLLDKALDYLFALERRVGRRMR